MRYTLYFLYFNIMYIWTIYHFNIMFQIIIGGTTRGGDLLVTNVGLS